ncbi:MAG: hypothetical protein RLZZ516_2278 [Cyanobacteriota bacterium]
MQVAPLRALIALSLAVLTLCGAGFGPQKAAGSAAFRPAAGSLQEVPPPGAVVQVSQRLADHNPVVEVLAPADETLLPAGPWTLKVRVRDWPMPSQASAELGPHLMVQLDQNEPRHLRADSGDSDTITAQMPPLEPGSHRLTVYAARAWGEAVKAPGAVRQIHLNRVARNPSQLPPKGTAQLIVASPDALQQEEPVLIDWLLLDAPLQHLRDDDARWRLRVSVNGDSVLVDRQTPLWLKGFQRGSNAVLLELLDDRGEPLNAPFNSVVREVTIGAGPQASWRRTSLSADALALLSGEPPAQPQDEAEPETGARPDTQTQPEAEATGDDPAPLPPSTDKQTAAQPDPEPSSEEAEPEAAAEAEPAEDKPTDEPAVVPAEAAPAPSPSSSVRSGNAAADATGVDDAAENVSEPDGGSETETPETAEARLTAGSSLGGSARDQVNADGSLLQPQRRGALAGLREKLGG